MIAFDDLTALGVVRGLPEAGMRVPQDCSVMGFDDVLPAEVATPSITTIRQPLKEMGCEAAERVVQAIRRGPGKPERDHLHMPCPELVVRMSTAGPPDGHGTTSRVAEKLPAWKGLDFSRAAKRKE